MKKVIASALAFAPSLALADAIGLNTNGLNETVNSLKVILNNVLVFMAGIAVLFFIIGVIKFILRPEDPEAQKGARSYMIYGVIGFAVIVGLYGLVGFLLDFFGVNQQAGITIPSINTQ